MGRGKHCTSDQRNIIKQMRRNGHTYKFIASAISCSTSMVINALKWTEKPENRGRPRKTSKRADQLMIRYAKQNQFVSSSEIKKHFALSVDSSTVRRRFLDNQLYCRAPRKKPLLQKRHLENRLKFAKNHLNWAPEKWRNIL